MLLVCNFGFNFVCSIVWLLLWFGVWLLDLFVLLIRARFWFSAFGDSIILWFGFYLFVCIGFSFFSKLCLLVCWFVYLLVLLFCFVDLFAYFVLVVCLLFVFYLDFVCADYSVCLFVHLLFCWLFVMRGVYCCSLLVMVCCTEFCGCGYAGWLLWCFICVDLFYVWFCYLCLITCLSGFIVLVIVYCWLFGFCLWLMFTIIWL